jgi:hypothetical protein
MTLENSTHTKTSVPLRSLSCLFGSDEIRAFLFLHACRSHSSCAACLPHTVVCELVLAGLGCRPPVTAAHSIDSSAERLPHVALLPFPLLDTSAWKTLTQFSSQQYSHHHHRHRRRHCHRHHGHDRLRTVQARSTQRELHFVTKQPCRAGSHSHRGSSSRKDAWPASPRHQRTPLTSQTWPRRSPRRHHPSTKPRAPQPRRRSTVKRWNVLLGTLWGKRERK